MTRVRFAALGDVCTFTGGGTPSRKQPDYFAGEIPWATVKDFKNFTISDTEEHITEHAVRDSATNIVERGSVLLVTRVGLGKIAVAGTRLAINQDIKAVQPNADLDPEFLFWFLLSQAGRIQAMGTGATVKGVTLNDVKAIRCPVPSRVEQRRIVDLLSRAEGIVRLRRDAQQKAAELIPAIFLDLFGDPAANPKRWPIKSLSDIADTQLGKMLDKKKQTGFYTFPYLGNSNVRWGVFDLGDLLQMDFNESERIKFELRAGDLLVCEGGEVGRAAIWRGQKEDCYFQKALHRVRTKPTLAVPEFMLWWLWTMAQHGLLASAGAKATIAHLPAEKLRALKVALPPLDLQRQFAAKAEAVRSIATCQTAALATAQAAFDALLHQAFA